MWWRVPDVGQERGPPSVTTHPSAGPAQFGGVSPIGASWLLARRPFDQDHETFLLEVVIVCQDLGDPSSLHGIH